MFVGIAFEMKTEINELVVNSRAKYSRATFTQLQIFRLQRRDQLGQTNDCVRPALRTRCEFDAAFHKTALRKQLLNIEMRS